MAKSSTRGDPLGIGDSDVPSDDDLMGGEHPDVPEGEEPPEGEEAETEKAPSGKDAESDEADAPEGEEPDDEEADEPESESDTQQRGDPTKALQQARLENKRLKQSFEQSVRAEADRIRREADQRLERVKQAFQQLQREQQSRAQQDMDPRPDPAADPAGYIEWQERQNVLRVERVNQDLQQTREELALSRDIQAAEQYDRMGQSEFPDYDTATQHVAEVWADEMVSAGVPPEQLPQALATRARAFVQGCLRAGKLPHQELYRISKRFGYAGAPAKPPAATRVEQVKIASKSPAAKTINRSGRSAGNGEIGRADLMTMKDDDFAALSDRELIEAMNRG